MKRNLLAIAIPALLVAAGANASIEVWNKDGNKVDFYGRVKAANRITDRDQAKEGDKTEARLGMSGQTQITDALTGYGRWEWQTNTGKNSFDETRYAFAGLNFGDYGSFDYGRNDGVLKAITAYTDVLPEFGGDAANNNWYTLSDRTKAVATYRNNNFFGLNDDISFALQYADNGDNSSTIDGKRTTDSREAYGVNAQWRIFDTGVTVGAGYAQTSGSSSRHNNATSQLGNGDAYGIYANGRQSTWTGGVKYDNYNVYLAANYFQSKLQSVENTDGDRFDLKIKGVELVAQYGFDLEVGRLTPSLAYVQHKLDSNDYLAKYVALGANYQLNKNFSALIEYKFNLLDRNDAGAVNNTKGTSYDSYGDLVSSTKAGTKDVLGVGLIYQF